MHFHQSIAFLKTIALGEEIGGIYCSGENRFELTGIVKNVFYNTDMNLIVVSCKCIDIQKIKDGDFTVPKDKPLQQSQQAQQADSSTKSDFIEIEDDDLPF